MRRRLIRGRTLAFVSAGGSGTVTVAKVEADKLTVVQTLTTERGARTMTVDYEDASDLPFEREIAR